MIYDLIGSGSAAYEAKLHSLSAKLPSTIQVNFIGQLSPEALQARLQPSGLSSSALRKHSASLSHLPPHLSQVSSLIPQVSGLSYHALLMPSLTENFSYTVLESLQAGIPVLISDQTPWRDLQSQRSRLGFALGRSQRVGCCVGAAVASSFGRAFGAIATCFGIRTGVGCRLFAKSCDAVSLKIARCSHLSSSHSS